MLKRKQTKKSISPRRGRWRRIGLVAGIALGLLSLLILLGPRLESDFELRYFHFADATPQRIQSFVAAREAARETLRPGLQGRVVLQEQVAQRTPWSIVYLHGFSASPREVYPFVETLAESMHAHAYIPRLSGHGLDPDGLGEEASLQAWMDDTMEALAIGRVLGERVLVVGYSNGANLALLAAAHAVPDAQPDALVLMAPNFLPADPSARLLTWPWARVWVPLRVGRERIREALHEAHAEGWSMRYATQALFPMMASVEAVRRAPLESLQVPTKLIYAETDRVVDIAAIEQGFERIGSPQKEKLTLEEVGDPSGHIIAGDAFSPATTLMLVEAIHAFVDDL
jgi:alpha-beta hydrolase superfamily lysophospholipase